MAPLRLSRSLSTAVLSLALCMAPLASASAQTVPGTTQPSAGQIEQRIQSALGDAKIQWNVVASNQHVMILHGMSTSAAFDISINCVITFNPFSINCTIKIGSASAL